MDLYDVMRTTFAARQFTNAPVPDEVLARILDHARFAPSGGNRQGNRVIIVREPRTKAALAALAEPAAKRYAAQYAAGEGPWNPVTSTAVDAATIARTPAPRILTEPLKLAPVVLVVCVDLRAVAAMDQFLPRIGLVAGASVYPFVWNILLAARNEGYGGTITTLAIAEEPQVKALLGIPDEVAVCAVIPLGQPVQQFTRLKRRPVSELAVRERWDGEPVEALR
ncbi:MAG: nitroreductase family protein [Dehalococcoidia bacterium]